MKCADCSFCWQGENDDFPCCHCEEDMLPCDLDDLNKDDDDYDFGEWGWVVQ